MFSSGSHVSSCNACISWIELCTNKNSNLGSKALPSKSVLRAARTLGVIYNAVLSSPMYSLLGFPFLQHLKNEVGSEKLTVDTSNEQYQICCLQVPKCHPEVKILPSEL